MNVNTTINHWARALSEDEGNIIEVEYEEGYTTLKYNTKIKIHLGLSCVVLFS